MGKVVLVVLVFGVVVYATLAMLERKRVGLPMLPRRKPAPPAQKQSAPDDDEEFLRWLDRKSRHEKPEADPPDGE